MIIGDEKCHLSVSLQAKNASKISKGKSQNKCKMKQSISFKLTLEA